jgi:hypothetical protein
MKLQGSLPQGDSNGLVVAAQGLVDDPDSKHVAVVILDCSKITEDVDSGDRVPTVRIRRIELIQGDDGEVLMRLLHRAFEARTGKVVLPFEMERDLQETFGAVTRVDANGEIIFLHPDSEGNIPPVEPRTDSGDQLSGSPTGRPVKPVSFDEMPDDEPPAAAAVPDPPAEEETAVSEPTVLDGQPDPEGRWPGDPGFIEP